MHRSTPRAAYELAAAQVHTPTEVIKLFWQLAHERRDYFERVVDFGAADGRFAFGGNYGSYLGIEIDPSWSAAVRLPERARIKYACAFESRERPFDACIGNPPYVRHHDIEAPWKKATAYRLGSALGTGFRMDANLYLYFFALAFAKAKRDGLVGLILPYEWTTRPSASALRQTIQKNHWAVDVYRFNTQIFEGVLTTASITFVDKAATRDEWRFFDIGPRFGISQIRHLTRKKRAPLPYAQRARIWARRGISPGNQKVFVLTEGERIHAGLSRRDVRRAVTSLRSMGEIGAVLSKSKFEQYFVQAGRRCWLIRTRTKRLSSALAEYLRRVPKQIRDTATCRRQDPWYAYEQVPTPSLLFQSCFVRRSPTVVVNQVRAIPVGTTHGVYAPAQVATELLREHLAQYPFRDSVIPHAHKLRKVEVKQLNHVLTSWHRRQS